MKIKVSKYVADKLGGLSRKDFKIQAFKGSGPGGQRRNKVETAIRITHIETSISAEATNSRKQIQNRRAAFKKLVEKLIVHYQIEETKDQRLDLNLGQRIRTYNEKRGTVKDHRTNVVLNYDAVLDGDLDSFMEAHKKARQ